MVRGRAGGSWNHAPSGRRLRARARAIGKSERERESERARRLQQKQLLRERGGRAVCQRGGG